MHKYLELHSTIYNEKILVTNFSFFNGFTQPLPPLLHPLNSQNPLSMTKDFCRCSLTVLSTDVCVLFHTFFCSLLSVSKKWNIETVLPFLYSYNWQKFRNHKMNEKRSQEYQSMDPESVTGQINSRILELLLRRFCCLIFALSRKILI